MDHNDREQFWKTLCSLPGNDIVAEREQLFKSIKYPKLLFRYRPVSTKSLEALRTNKLYFSSANYYDDPFDTFLHIDIEAIRKEYKRRRCAAIAKQCSKGFRDAALTSWDPMGIACKNRFFYLWHTESTVKGISVPL